MRPLAVVIMIGILWPQVAHANAPTMESTTSAEAAVRRHLHDRLVGIAEPSARGKGKQPLQAPELVRQFYAKRDYWPAWSYLSGLSSQVDALLAALWTAEREGLPLLQAHLWAINTQLAMTRHLRRDPTALDTARLATLDLLLRNENLIT